MDDNDWRLQVQEKYLTGVSVTRPENQPFIGIEGLRGERPSWL